MVIPVIIFALLSVASGLVALTLSGSLVKVFIQFFKMIPLRLPVAAVQPNIPSEKPLVEKMASPEKSGASQLVGSVRRQPSSSQLSAYLKV